MKPASQLWLSKLLVDEVVILSRGDTLVAQKSLSHIIFLIAIQSSLYLLGSLLVACQESIRPLLGELLGNQVSLSILRKTNELDVSFFENEQFYNKLQNAYQEASYRPLEIAGQLLFLAQTVIALSSMVILLFRLHWVTLVIIIVTTAPNLIIQSKYGSRNYWMLRERAPDLRKQSYFGMLLTSNWFIKEIRLFHLEDYFLNLYESLFTKFFRQNRDLIVKKNIYSFISSSASILGWFLAAGFVALRTITKAITIGDFTLYMQAISSTQVQLQALLSGIGMMYSNSLFLRNLFEFLTLPTQDLSAGSRWTEPIKEIEFRNVSFCYPGTNRPVLDSVSFRVRRGQSLALVGKNGAGKTTLIKLLCRLYEPMGGVILINGKNIADFSPRSIQERMAVLFQDYGNYYIKARENIGVGRIGNMADFRAIKTAARRSGANIGIEALPDKYETMLGKWFEEGVELSGGEWQKIALARGLVRKGDILILDEPTASLDAEAEFKVFQDMIKYRVDQITILISHRFSTIRMADHILVLERGKCIEAGSHDELISNNGHYSYLFKLQAKGYT